MSKIFRFVVMVWLGLMALALVILGVAFTMISVIWSLLRGRKPAAVTVFQGFRRASKGFGQGAWAGGGPAPSAKSTDVVDVQAREVGPSMPGVAAALPAGELRPQRHP